MGLLDRWRTRLTEQRAVTPSTAKVRTLPGGRIVKVVGEAYYQESLDQVCGGRTEDGHARECTATLVPEPRNPYDRNAVGVWIDGRQVGHLSREDALRYKPVVRRLAANGEIGACAALILGGWARRLGDVGHYGVTLSLASPGDCLKALDGENTVWPDPWVVLRQEPGYRAHRERTRRKEAEQAGYVRGRFYTEWVPTLDKLRAEKRDDEALELLLEIIDATERASQILGEVPPPAYTGRAAIILRRKKDYAGEVAVLERWMAACPPGAGSDRFIGRLAKARALAVKAGQLPPT